MDNPLVWEIVLVAAVCYVLYQFRRVVAALLIAVAAVGIVGYVLLYVLHVNLLYVGAIAVVIVIAVFARSLSSSSSTSVPSSSGPLVTSDPTAGMTRREKEDYEWSLQGHKRCDQCYGQRQRSVFTHRFVTHPYTNTCSRCDGRGWIFEKDSW